MERKLRVNGEDKEYLSIHQWTGAEIMAGLPSTNVPIGFSSDDLSNGMQIIGLYLQDLTYIEVAKVVRELRGGFSIPPKYQK